MCSSPVVTLFPGSQDAVVTNTPLKKVLQGPDGVSRLIPWAVGLSEFDMEYTPRKAINAQVVAKVLVDFMEGEVKEPELEYEVRHIK